MEQTSNIKNVYVALHRLRPADVVGVVGDVPAAGRDVEVPGVQEQPRSPRCRVCAGIAGLNGDGQHRTMVPIFQGEEVRSDLASKINRYLPISVEHTDRLPLLVCDECLRDLETCHHLVQCCIQADCTLRQILGEEELSMDVNTKSHTENKFTSPQTSSQISEEQVPFCDEVSIEAVERAPARPSGRQSSPTCSAQPLSARINRKLNNKPSVSKVPNRPGLIAPPARSTRLSSRRIRSSEDPKQFSCWECGSVLADLAGFVQHQQQAHSRDLKPCHLCGKIFEAVAQLNRHMKSKHPTEATSVKCTSPSREAPTRASLSRRKSLPVVAGVKVSPPNNISIQKTDGKLTSSDKPSQVDDLRRDKGESKVSAYQCKICSKGYESKSARRNHYASVHDEYECKVCEELFSERSEAERHETQPHKIPCSHCPEYFQSQSSLKVHLSSKHLEGPKQFQCSQCGKGYVSKSGLLTHEKLHRIKEPSVCKVCNKSCKTPSALKYHMFVHMNDEEKAKLGFACTLCNKKFTGKTRLTLHMRRHTDERPCECPTCHKTFYDSERLKAHMENHSTEKKFKCDQCNACFVSKRYLVNHMYVSHKRRQVIRCIVCNKIIPNMREVVAHKQSHTAEELAGNSEPCIKSIEFHCKMCNEYFPRKELLRLHKARIHTRERVPMNRSSSGSIKQLECKVCDKKVWGNAGLSRHMRLHSDQTPLRTYQCEFCAKLFAQKIQMVLHIRTHTGERPFQCQFCEQSFINVNSLVVHERIHTGETPYPCDKCPKAFRSSNNLIAHLQTHSGVKPYECHVCHKRFGRLIHLKLHLRTHTGERPYACDLCGRAFTQAGDMRKHRLTHTGERAYKCGECVYSSNRRKTLVEHQQRVHPGSHPPQSPQRAASPAEQDTPQPESPTLPETLLSTSQHFPKTSGPFPKIYVNWIEN